MNKAYGFIEITGVVAAMDALDIMCKTADVELASWERKLGGTPGNSSYRVMYRLSPKLLKQRNRRQLRNRQVMQ